MRNPSDWTVLRATVAQARAADCVVSNAVTLDAEIKALQKGAEHDKPEEILNRASQKFNQLH